MRLQPGHCISMAQCCRNCRDVSDILKNGRHFKCSLTYPHYKDIIFIGTFRLQVLNQNVPHAEIAFQDSAHGNFDQNTWVHSSTGFNPIALTRKKRPAGVNCVTKPWRKSKKSIALTQTQQFMSSFPWITFVNFFRERTM